MKDDGHNFYLLKSGDGNSEAHLVTLSSVEDDALGEEVLVIVDSDLFHRLWRDRGLRVNPGMIKHATTKN